MSTSSKLHSKTLRSTAPLPKSTHIGPVDWRNVVKWLEQDGIISADEALRTVARCAQAESAQHPLVRLASVSMRRAADNKPLGEAALVLGIKYTF